MPLSVQYMKLQGQRGRGEGRGEGRGRGRGEGRGRGGRREVGGRGGERREGGEEREEENIMSCPSQLQCICFKQSLLWTYMYILYIYNVMYIVI